jgi:hypothetical protein
LLLALLAVVLVVPSLDRATAAPAAVAYASFLGADGRDTAERVVSDSAGNHYLTGWVEGTNFPTPTGSGVKVEGGLDVYVIKLSPEGRVLYTTVFGGGANDLARSIVVDPGGNAFVTGTTYSPDFPLVAATLAGDVGGGAAFVTRLDPSGKVTYSDFVSGNNFVSGNDISLDPAGGVYVAGFVLASNLPVTPGAFQPAKSGPLDAYVLKLRADLSGVEYCTYLGGGAHPLSGFASNYDEIYGVSVDASGSAYVAGVTDAVDFPTTAGAAQSLPGGQRDAFVAKLAPDGRSLVYATRVGGIGDDQASELTIDGTGNAYLVGRTGSPNFPAKNPAQATPGSVTDAFVTKVNPTGTGLTYSTVLGGSGTDYGYDVSVDGAGRATVVGQTASANFPVAGAFQTTMKGTADGFVTRLASSGSTIELSTFLGGSGWDGLTGVEATASGALVSGFMYSPEMPTSPATQPAFGGGTYDGYVARIVG